MKFSWLGWMFVVGRVRRRVPILVHWSVPALGLFVLGTGVKHILTTAALIAAYLAMLVLHELGHQRAAERRGCRVIEIRIYPLHGSCRYELSSSRYDEALIAWGGPAAQFLVAAPCAIFIKTVGSTGMAPLDVVLSVLGVLSPIVALSNLLPIAPLDGRKAWAILPIAWSRIRRRKSRQPQTAMEAMEEALRKASKRRRA